MSETMERIDKSVDKLFSKVNSLAESIAVNAAILPRIEKKLDELPCENHERKIAKLDKEFYAVKTVRLTIVGLLALTGTILGIVSIAGKMFGWF